MAETKTPLDRSPLLQQLRQGKFDFLDLGCSRGDSMDQAKHLFEAKRGLGIDIDRAKIEQAIAAGHDAMILDIHQLPMRPLVRFSTLIYFLEHVPNRKDVRLYIRHAVAASREFVFIRQHYFDADGYLFRRGLKFFWSDWRGHPNTMSTLDFHSILARMRNAGVIGNFSIHVRNPIKNSAHEAVLPIGAPPDQSRYNPAIHPIKSMDIEFEECAFAEVIVFITKPGIEHYSPFGKIKFDRTFFDSSLSQKQLDVGRPSSWRSNAGSLNEQLPDSISAESSPRFSNVSTARHSPPSSSYPSASCCESSTPPDELSGQTSRINGKLDFVVVTFPGEIEMLNLQLKSIEKFVDKETMGRLYIFWNSNTGKTSTHIRDVRAYIADRPGLCNKTELLMRDDIFGRNDLFDSNGWRSQQALKIACSRFVREEFAVVLDTKNHFIRSVSYNDFISAKGRPYTHFVNYTRGDPAFLHFLKNSCAYFGTTCDAKSSRAGMPTTTPLTIKKSTMLAMLDLIEHRERTDILTAFFCSNDLKDTTEFLLYYAFVLKEFGRASEVYDQSSPIAVTFFSTSPKSAPGIIHLLRRLDGEEVKVLGIHRERFKRLGEQEKETFRNVWISAGLFADAVECNRFLSTMHAP